MGSREKRIAAGLPLLAVAAAARVSETTARIYEIDPAAVKDATKRGALDAVYGDLSKIQWER